MKDMVDLAGGQDADAGAHEGVEHALVFSFEDDLHQHGHPLARCHHVRAALALRLEVLCQGCRLKWGGQEGSCLRH